MILLSSDYYQIKKTRKKGRGIFAHKEIPAGTIIGDYTGLVLKDKDAEKEEEKYDNACYSMDYQDNGLSIFPLKVEGLGIHLINHSCSPNCDTYYYFGHTLFFTSRRILVGEELTIDYSFDPDHKKDWLHACFCGSPFCRGTMYSSDAKLKLWGSFCRKETRGQKFKLLKAGEILQPLGKYPKEIKDNEVFNLFANQKAIPMKYDDKKLPSIKELRKRLRDSGRMLYFKNIGLKLMAIVDGRLIFEK
jgi:hypothetical protein